MKILIVGASYIHPILAVKGEHEIQAVAEGREAREALRQTNYDLVIIEKELPDSSGLQLLEAIKQISPQVEVILLGHQGDAEEFEALKLGAFGYLPKPVSGPRLQRWVEVIAYRRRTRQE